MSITIQSVARAAAILRAVAEGRSGLTNTEIAEQTDLNASTSHHLVGTLVQVGLLRRLDAGRYGIGYAAMRLYDGFKATASVDPELLDAVTDVARQTGDTAYVSRWADGAAVIEQITEGSRAVRVGALHTGYSEYSHLRASGKVLLANLSDSELDRYLAATEFERLTEHSVADRESLLAQLQTARESGYAVDLEEFADGVCCIAVPICLADGLVLGALTVSSPRDRFDRHWTDWISTLQQRAAIAAARISARDVEAQERQLA